MPPWTDGAGNPTSRVLYTFSAGNSQINIADPNVVQTPSKLLQAAIPQNVLIVGAVKSTTANSDFSCYGAPVVNIWAPGTDWKSLSPGGGTMTASGTSFAAPAIAGVAALTLARFPALTGMPTALQQRLIGNAASTVTVNVGCGNKDTNQPLVDANAAVTP